MKTSYRERDYAFGQSMLTLRIAVGLTQAALAEHLGVSRRAVGEWETGNSYPKAQHLKALIALAVQQQVFSGRNAAEEIRALWKSAHQKTWLDEHWLSALLDQRVSSQPQVRPALIEENWPVDIAVGADRVPAPLRASSPIPLPIPLPSASPLALVPSTPEPLLDWDDALTVPCFYGRTEELALLSQWVVSERCHLVSMLGIGGIGKSALAIHFMHQVAPSFEIVIFRSLRDAPSCESLLSDCLQVLASHPQGQVLGLRESAQDLRGSVRGLRGPVQELYVPDTLEECIGLLLEYLRQARVLMVLDNMESLLEHGDVRGHFRSGFEGYGQLLRRVAETAHQSCLLLTSREKPARLRPLEGKHALVHSLRLSSLDATACKQLFMDKEMVGTEADQERLMDLYGGNPLALKIVTETIRDLFGGEISEFLSSETGLFGNVTDLLGEQFARLSALERSVLCWLAIMREPVTLDELQQLLVIPLPRVQVFEAVDGLHRRCLIERGKRPGGFTLQSGVLEYVTAVLIAEGSREIQQHRLDQLLMYGLFQSSAREYVQQAQERLLLSPLLASLQSAYLGRVGQAQGSVPTRLEGTYGGNAGQAQGSVPTRFGGVPMDPVEAQLLSLLRGLREQDSSAQGYGPANLIALLRLLRGHLSSLDLTNLSIRGASLQGIQMQKTSLSGSMIRNTVFTEAVCVTWGVATSPDGSLWAVGGMRGEIRVWGEGGRTLQLTWQAHTDTVMTLAFSPDGRMLASGSLDNTVKLWDVGASPGRERDLPLGPYEDGTREGLLWTNWCSFPYHLAFSTDSSLLACAGMGSTVPIWDTHSGTKLQNLEHPARILAISWSPDGRFLVSSCIDEQLYFWERPESEPENSSQAFRLSTTWPTGPLWGLAFAPDGRTFVSVGWQDRKLKLWEVETRNHGAGPRVRLLHTFEGETNQLSHVAFSPDGATVASCSYNQTIWLWNVEQRRHRATLSGHASDINRMAFTADSSRLLSISNDGTLRVWDVESGQCIRVTQGYAVSHYDLDWSPDGRYLVSGGTDGIVTIWDTRAETPPRTLHGHTFVTHGVGWSPDGQRVASCGWDMVVRLWNPTSGVCIQSFNDPPTPLLDMAWSPDGSLLAVTTYLHGMCVWNMRESRHHWIGEPGQIRFLSASWSPDGSLLAGGSDDGSVYLWESKDGTRRKQLLGHHGDVRSLVWSPDGTRLASGARELLMWDVLTGDCVRTFGEHPDIVYAVAWIPGENQLVSGSSDGRLRWWNAETGECVSMQEAHQGPIRSLKVSPDGKSLASCGGDGAIMIWNLCSGGLAPPLVRTLRHDRPYERLNITGIRGLTKAQKSSLLTLGAIEE